MAKQKTNRGRGLLAVAIAFATSCSPGADETPATTPPAERPITLRDVMLEIGESTKIIAAGIWAEDHSMIRRGAVGVADHATPNPDQLQAIKSVLGEDMQIFVASDQLVHQLAVDLKTMADEEAPRGQILGGLHALEAGCLSCHEQFRERLIEAGVTGQPATPPN